MEDKNVDKRTTGHCANDLGKCDRCGSEVLRIHNPQAFVDSFQLRLDTFMGSLNDQARIQVETFLDGAGV